MIPALPLRRLLPAVIALAVLAGCQDRRNEFNPIRVLCPGQFDPVTNTCRVPTGPVVPE